MEWNRKYRGIRADLVSYLMETSKADFIIANNTYSSEDGRCDLALIKIYQKGIVSMSLLWIILLFFFGANLFAVISNRKKPVYPRSAYALPEMQTGG